MLHHAPDITALLVLVTWCCINVETWINPRFRYVLPSQHAVGAHIRDLGFTYCAGLFEAINAATPPTIQWFEQLRADIPIHCWGVYVLVLKKRGHPDLIYIGSGTAWGRGVRGRISEHRANKVQAKHLKRAIDIGYKITAIRLLAHCPKPASAGDVPKFRTAVVALEATFACLF